MQTSHRTIFLSTILAMFLAPGVAAAQNSGVASGYPVPKDDLTPQQRTGEGLYKRYCIGCHGLKGDRKSTRLNFSHGSISYAVFCLKKKKKKKKLAQNTNKYKYK